MNLNLVVAEEAPAIADHENILLNQIENIKLALKNYKFKYHYL